MLRELQATNAFEEVWAAPEAESRPGPRLLSALRQLARAAVEPLAPLRAILALALDAARAERVFFFDVPAGPPGEPPALGQCLASLNLDREPVLDPLSKAPMALLREVLVSGRALVAGDVESDPRRGESQPLLEARARGLGVVPLACRGRTVGLLYFDHRFQPLNLEPERAAELAALCHALAALHHGERLVAENRSLWQDVTQLRERTRSDSTVAPRARAEPRARPNRSRFRGDYSLIVGSSPPIHEIFQLLDRVSGSSAPVLINGESGTGKELIANAVHQNSPRHGKPFVSENCGALTETLLESELFGYVKGAFTGAGKDHKGLFELADSGTLFLDEVGDMSPTMQKKLLRVIQEGVIRRVGGKDFIKVDVRLICATNKDLLEECRQGRFREDLYYRLNVININVPALRERLEDVPELVEQFLRDLARQGGKEKALEPEAMKRLVQYTWPGNVRELQNEVKRMYALSDDAIRVTDLSPAILEGDGRDFLQPSFEKELLNLTLKDATERLERELIKRALFAAKGNKSLVAKKLQVPKTSLYNKINKYQLDKELP